MIVVSAILLTALNTFAQGQFDAIKKLLKKQHVDIDISSNAINYLADVGYEPSFGARPIKRLIQKRIINQLSKDILSGSINKDGLILVDTEGDSLVFRNETAPLEEIGI